MKIGIGQSMGGCLTVVQQGRFHSYDGVGVLGYGVFGTLPPTAPGHAAISCCRGCRGMRRRPRQW